MNAQSEVRREGKKGENTHIREKRSQVNVEIWYYEQLVQNRFITFDFIRSTVDDFVVIVAAGVVIFRRILADKYMKFKMRE